MSRVKSCNSHVHYRAGCPACQAKARAEFNRRKLRQLRGAPVLLVDPTGTRRRVQALQVIGWDRRRLAAALGRTPESLGQNLRSPRIHQKTASAIAILYDELCDTPGPSDRARRRAEREGWAGPSMWTDATIDDPDAKPVKPNRTDALFENLEWLIDSGCGWEHIPARLGISREGIATACRRHGRTDLLERIRKAAAA